MSGKQLGLKIMAFARELIEARRRNAARGRARKNQQLLDASSKRDDEKDS